MGSTAHVVLAAFANRFDVNATRAKIRGSVTRNARRYRAVANDRVGRVAQSRGTVS